MITQSLHGYFIQIPPEIITALNLPENTSFDCSLNGSVIHLSPLADYTSAPPASSFSPTFNIHPITINCFGKFQLLFHELPVPIKNKKARELLSLLICERGNLVGKKKAASMLWPGSTATQAMNSLYKVCQYLKHAGPPISLLPLAIDNQYLSLDIRLINSDLTTFMQLISLKDGNFPSCGIAAEALYTGPLLFDECYDWVAPYEAYYDIHYSNLVDRLSTYFTQTGNSKMAEYYQNKFL